MRLWLTPAQAQQIVQHVLDARPFEGCGLIGGIGDRAQQIVPVSNIAPNPEHHFRLDDKGLTQAMFDFDRTGLSLIGIYHSHPNSDPIPSQTDIQLAAYPDTAYLIVGLRGEPSLAAWEIRYGVVSRIDLHISPQPPEPEEHPLSRAQKIAIILAAIVALLFMLLLSLSLLPPAPVIATP